MKILVAGASGFIGKNVLAKWSLPDTQIIALYHSTPLAEFCAKKKLNHVIPVRCDLGSPSALEGMSEEYGDSYDVIIYLAANGDPAKSEEYPALDLEMNTKYLIHMLERVKCEKLLYFSSGAVYDTLKGPVSPASELNPTLPYAISKLASERYIKFFSHVRQTVTKYFLIRFFGAYGDFEPERKIFRRLLRTFLNKKSTVFPIKGNGENLIDAMHVNDTIRALEKIVQSDDKESLTLDLASDSPLTLNQLVKTVASIHGCKVELKHAGRVPEYIEFRTVDETMKKVFDFTPEITMETGIKMYRDDLERGCD